MKLAINGRRKKFESPILNMIPTEEGLSPMELKKKRYMEFFPELHKVKRKLTALTCSGSDLRTHIVTRGMGLSGAVGVTLIGSKPRSKKLFSLDPYLANGAVFLDGHVTAKELPVFEADVTDAQGTFRVVFDWVGGRFTDWAGDNGKSIIEGLKSRLVFHTLSPTEKLTLRKPWTTGNGDCEVIDDQFQRTLIDALGEPRNASWIESPNRPPVSRTKEVFTEKLVSELKAKCGKEDFPVARLFTTSGASTWLLYSMEDDEETLWGIVDIGQGVVEYGSLSRRDFESYRDKLGFGVERDKFWKGTTKTISQICEMTTIQTGV